MSLVARPLRRDAQRNRDALVDAARQVLAERGVDAPLEAVAKRAGVAIGTLYRHFPERGDLIDAILDEKVTAWTELARQALAVDDAWEGLVRFLEETCELQAKDRAFTELAYFLMANSRVAEADPEQWRRHFRLMLDALRARPEG
ncbi:TetR/AcrR family transcriptional regulator [Nonomuraea sp. H19]|uniref:TetR/AcrR family transcriptional regulator n=1 Tax=Nonomuraea sp. H19 TaxID=3452206 RepID=UPI003F88B876